jgi:hypothetical protein
MQYEHQESCLPWQAFIRAFNAIKTIAVNLKLRTLNSELLLGVRSYMALIAQRILIGRKDRLRSVIVGPQCLSLSAALAVWLRELAILGVKSIAFDEVRISVPSHTAIPP